MTSADLSTIEDEGHPNKHHYAVIFTSTLTGQDLEGYRKVGQRLDDLALQQDGCLGLESARSDGPAGLGITVSYWSSLKAIRAWKANAEHAVSMQRGKSVWYQHYIVRVTKVEREYSFQRPATQNEGTDAKIIN